MKTLVKTLFATALTVIVLSSSALTSVAANKESELTVLSAEIDFNKVVITGNVHVELVQANQQRVIIYEAYNKATTSVKQKGDKLFINSVEEEPINIVVYVRDLQRIDASNTVTVKTGTFSASVLQVFLKDKARAYVSGNIGSLYTLIKDKSELKLNGTTNDHISVKGKVARLKTDSFAALNTTSSVFEEVALVQNNVLSLSKDSVIADRQGK